MAEEKPDEETRLNIYQRLNEVRKEVAYIQKDTKVDNKYSAVSHDVVTAAVRKSLIEHGIMIVPSVQESTMQKKHTTSAGTPIFRYEARFHIYFRNIDEPSDHILMALDGHGDDTGDKAPGKALSYAVKYAILKLFNLETGMNEEGRFIEEAEAVTQEQVNELYEVVAAHYEGDELQEAKVDANLRRLAAAMGAATIADLPSDRFDEAMVKLKTGLEKVKEVGNEPENDAPQTEH